MFRMITTAHHWQEVVQEWIVQIPRCSPQMFPVPLVLLHSLSLHVHVTTALRQDTRATLLRDHQSSVTSGWTGVDRWLWKKRLTSTCLFTSSGLVRGQRTRGMPGSGWRSGSGSSHPPESHSSGPLCFKNKKKTKTHTQYYWLQARFHFPF